MLAKRLLDNFRAQFDQLEKEQLGRIDLAAAMVADSLLNGGAWHVHDTGHIIDRELINRGGGLMCIKAFSWTFAVTDDVPACRKGRPAADADYQVALETVRLAVRASNVRAGDVMVIGSVSGRSLPTVELAIECRRIGCKVIAISSKNYSSQVESRHPSGKRLYECADLFIDNLAPLGDGHMQIDGCDVPVFPVSGINAAAIMWMMAAQVIEKMQAQGKMPQICKSANIDGGAERNRRLATEVVNVIGY